MQQRQSQLLLKLAASWGPLWRVVLHAPAACLPGQAVLLQPEAGSERVLSILEPAWVAKSGMQRMGRRR
jgi:hypothetical protein